MKFGETLQELSTQLKSFWAKTKARWNGNNVVGRICDESVRRKMSGKGGRSIASLLQGEGLCKTK